MAKPIAEMTGQDLLGWKAEEKQKMPKTENNFPIRLPEGLQKFLEDRGYKITEYSLTGDGTYDIKLKWEGKLEEVI